VLQAPLQKIDLQRLLADLSFQFRHPAFGPALFSITWKRVARTLSELPAPPVQRIRPTKPGQARDTDQRAGVK
jgi:hypothetical protein